MSKSNLHWLLGALFIAVLCLAANSVSFSPVTQGTAPDRHQRRRDAILASPSMMETEAGDSSEESVRIVRVPEEQCLVRKIVSKQYSHRSEVAAGRLLENFEVLASRLQSVDITRSRLRSQGPEWAQVEAPFVAEKHGGPVGKTAAPPETTAWLRFVRSGGEWKLEDLRLLPLREFR